MNTPQHDLTFQAIQTCPIVPVITITNLEHAPKLAEAFWRAGITTAEITLRTPEALEAIHLMKQAVPELCVGAGTILNTQDLDASLKMGSDFIVTPAVSSKLLPAIKACAIPVFPGAATASEALELYDNGFTHVKFFPAEANGGVPALKAIGAPMPQIKFMPTGGINGESAPDYLALSNVIAVGGSWMVDKNAIANEDWRMVEQTALTARLKLVRE